MKRWRDAGFDLIVSLLTPDEVDEMDLKMEDQCSGRHHIEFISFPIIDRSVPESRSATIKLIERLEGDLSKGKSINIHCRQGIGRSSVIAAGLLVARGMLPEEAFNRISRARQAPVPETSEQRKWIDSLASSLAPVAQSKGRP